MGDQVTDALRETGPAPNLYKKHHIVALFLNKQDLTLIHVSQQYDSICMTCCIGIHELKVSRTAAAINMHAWQWQFVIKKCYKIPFRYC